MTNLLRTIHTKFYRNWSGFVDCLSKNILACFFSVHSVCQHIRELQTVKNSPFCICICITYIYIYTYKLEVVKQYGLTFPNGIFKASYALSKISNISHMSLQHTNCQHVTSHKHLQKWQMYLQCLYCCNISVKCYMMFSIMIIKMFTLHVSMK